jgi:hypothetical protein
VDLHSKCLHSGVLVDQELVLLGEAPVVLVPHPHVDGEVLEIQLVSSQFDGYLTLLYDLLLLHRLFPVDFAHLVVHFLTNTHSLGQQLHPSRFLEDAQKDGLDVSSFQIGINGDVSDELELVEPVVELPVCIAGQKQLDAHLSRPRRDALLQVERSTTDESVFLERGLSVLELQS